jgi:peroxiredoxin
MRAFAVALLLAASPAVALEPGAALPELTAGSLQESAPLALKSFRGQVLYVDFWASWCVPCRLSMPTLDALFRKHSARGFTVLGINKDNTIADAQRFLKRVPVTFSLARDAQDQLARAFDVKAMPSGYLVDRRGVVRRVHRGFTAETAAALEREIEELLKEPA